jgi:hypothetical protein
MYPRFLYKNTSLKVLEFEREIVETNFIRNFLTSLNWKCPGKTTTFIIRHLKFTE